MNTLRKINLAVVLVFAITFTAFSGSITEGKSRAVKKAIEAVEAAEAYDWQTLAKSAAVCFEKKENMEQALTWITKSIELNEDPYNLEVMGDYYSGEGQNKKAMEYYYKAITVGKEQNFWNDSQRLQKKIWDLR